MERSPFTSERKWNLALFIPFCFFGKRPSIGYGPFGAVCASFSFWRFRTSIKKRRRRRTKDLKIAICVLRLGKQRERKEEEEERERETQERKTSRAMHEALVQRVVIDAPGLRLEAAELVTSASTSGSSQSQGLSHSSHSLEPEESSSQILATTSDGTLLQLKPPNIHAKASSSGAWQVVQAIKSFTRRKVTRLQHLQHHAYVLTQSDDGVGYFSLENFKSFEIIPNTKYPSCFCTNKQESLLCVATR